MKPPLILVDGGDITLFGSEDSLVRYVESPDVNDYFVFDALGEKLALVAEEGETNFLGFKLNKIAPVKVVRPAYGVDESDYLKLIVNKYILRNYGEDFRDLELSQLIEILEIRLGVVN